MILRKIACCTQCEPHDSDRVSRCLSSCRTHSCITSGLQGTTSRRSAFSSWVISHDTRRHRRESRTGRLRGARAIEPADCRGPSRGAGSRSDPAASCSASGRCWPPRNEQSRTTGRASARQCPAVSTRRSSPRRGESGYRIGVWTVRRILEIDGESVTWNSDEMSGCCTMCLKDRTKWSKTCIHNSLCDGLPYVWYAICQYPRPWR